MTSEGAAAERAGRPGTLGILGAAVIAIFLASLFSAQAGLLVLAASWIAGMSWHFPRQAFLLTLFVAPLLPILKATNVLSAVTPLKDVVIVTLFVQTTILLIVTKRDPYRRNRLLLPVLAFLAWVVIGVVRADAVVLGVLRARDLLLYVPLLWSARALTRSLDDVRIYTRVLLGSAFLTLLLVVLQYLAFPDGMVLRYDPARMEWISRASGTLAHPNLLASFLLFVIPLGGAVALESSIDRRWRLLAGVVVAAAVPAAYFTYSRSGWLALAIAVATLCLWVLARRVQSGRVRGAAVASALLVCFLLIGTVPRARTFLRTAVDPTYASNEERIGILASLVASGTSTGALIGAGLGDTVVLTSRDAFVTVEDIVSADVGRVRLAKARTFVDNAILKTGVELGLVGLLLVGWIILAGVHTARDVLRAGLRGEPRALAVGFLATTAGLIALSLFLDTPDIFPVALLWWSSIGVLQAVPFVTPMAAAAARSL